jgi:hypothetical protein
MKKAFIFASLCFSAFAFSQVETPIVGGDRDAHGCIGSAGYTYSQIKKDCIRTFEQKIKLSEVANNGSMMSAVIFSKDMKQAEVFLPTDKESLILKKSGKVWKNGKYTLLSPTKMKYVLKKDNVIIYK